MTINPSKPVYYVCHPLGSGPYRMANIARVKRWLRYLLKTYPDAAFCLPWAPYAEALEDTPDNNARGLQDDLEILERCDGLVLVGGRMSPGMREEYWHFRAINGCDKCVDDMPHMIMDLLYLGEEPPNE